MGRVTLPPSFRMELQKAMLPIAAALQPPPHALLQWADMWGFAPAERRALVAEQLERARSDDAESASDAPRKSVSFTEGTVSIQFFEPAGCLYATETAVKSFDGPSGHKTRRCVDGVPTGDEEVWEEMTRLMTQPRGSVCWSPTWM